VRLGVREYLTYLLFHFSGRTGIDLYVAVLHGWRILMEMLIIADVFLELEGVGE